MRASPETWLTRVEAEGHGLVENMALTPEEQGDEFLLMGLRLSEGVDPPPFRGAQRADARPRQAGPLIAGGFLARDPSGRLRVTAAGAPLLDTVVADVAA